MSPQQFRDLVRSGGFTGPTDRYLEKDIGPCRGYADANLAIVPEEYAFEPLLFCNRNPRPCPVIDVTEPGNPEPKRVAPGADLRTDIPRYRVFQNSEIVDEPTDILKYWRKDLVAFLIGSSTSFDWSMVAANVKFSLSEFIVLQLSAFQQDVFMARWQSLHAFSQPAMTPFAPSRFLPGSLKCMARRSISVAHQLSVSKTFINQTCTVTRNRSPYGRRWRCPVLGLWSYVADRGVGQQDTFHDYA